MNISRSWAHVRVGSEAAADGGESSRIAGSSTAPASGATPLRGKSMHHCNFKAARETNNKKHKMPCKARMERTM